MNCWFCGTGELIWGGDHDAEDYGHEYPGVVTNLTCSSCGAFWEGTQLDKGDGEDEENREDNDGGIEYDEINK